MRFLRAVMLLLAPGAAWSATPPRDFRAEMMARLQKARPGATLTADPDDDLAVIMSVRGVEEGRYYLHRLEAYCRHATARDCKNSKADYVANMSKKIPEATRKSLRLVLRDASYVAGVEEVAAQAPRSGDFTIHRQIGEDLYAFLAADSKDAIALVGSTTLQKLGLSAEEAWAIAAAQTRAVLPPLPDPAQLLTSAMMFQEQDYLASMLIDLPGWAAISAKVGPDLFVTVVADNIVFVGTMPKGARLDSFKKTVADDCAAQERCISPNVYRFRRGRWVIAK